MTPVGLILKKEILGSGPISFRRFMDAALYHPEHGYYRRGVNPFGKEGDYYTAEQIQPVFGILISACMKQLFHEMGEPRDFTVVELGAGRCEMAESLSEFRYIPIEVGDDLPEAINGVIFANEFIDALPVHAVVKRNSGFHEMLVGYENQAFCWMEGEPVNEKIALYLSRHASSVPSGTLLEVNLEALVWIENISRHLERGFVMVIDYGYTDPELARFPTGTLMSYRRHAATEDVLSDPGNRDITAHVCFTALQHQASQYGMRKVRFESLARMLLRIGETDQFEQALRGNNQAEIIRRRLQLKSLLFGMGETFQTLLLRKG